MTKTYFKKPIPVVAITFDELVAHGIAECGRAGRALSNGMPWSFSYGGHAITHENDGCYVIPTPQGFLKMGRDDMLITGVMGEIYPCGLDVFQATYLPAEPVSFGTEGIVAAAPDRPMSFDERAVGLQFNPSNDTAIYQCKRACAAVIDQLNDFRVEAGRTEAARLASVAITELQGAQMWAVKALTWKD